jgi:hypothetical protein
MNRVIIRSLVTVLLLTMTVAAYQVEPFSVKLSDGAEVTVFTYRQNDEVSIALRIVGPGEAQVFVSAIHNPDAGTMVTITPSGGHTYKIRRSPGKPVAVLDDQERPIDNPRVQADGAAFFDKIEAIRQAVAAKVAANSSVNSDVVGGSQSLQEIATSVKLFSAK